MSEAGRIVSDSLARQQAQREEAIKTAEEIDAQRERDRAAGVANGSLPPPAAPAESNQ